MEKKSKKFVKVQPCPGRAGRATWLGLRGTVDLVHHQQGQATLPTVHPHDQSSYTVTAFKRGEGNPPHNPPAKLLHPTILANTVSMPSARLQLNLCPKRSFT